MARKTGTGAVNGQSDSSRSVESSLPGQERRVATPRPDLFVLRIGDSYGKPQLVRKEQATGVLARLAKALSKPGADRQKLFQSSAAKPVYAYFIEAEDPTKVVREDVSGRRTVGRLVRGRFRALRSPRTT
jgi:hypothetical protein